MKPHLRTYRWKNSKHGESDEGNEWRHWEGQGRGHPVDGHQDKDVGTHHGLVVTVSVGESSSRGCWVVVVVITAVVVVVVKERVLRRQSMQNYRNQQDGGQDENVEPPEGGEHLVACLKKKIMIIFMLTVGTNATQQIWFLLKMLTTQVNKTIHVLLF